MAQGHTPAFKRAVLDVVLISTWLLLLLCSAAAENQASYDDYSTDNKLVFRMDNIDDLEELQHLVSFVDPDHGQCPVVHVAEQFFEGPEVLEPYSLAQLIELQSAYGDVLPHLRAEWVRRGGAAALDRLLYESEADGAGTAEEGATETIEADVGHGPEQPPSVQGSQGTFDLGAIAQQFDGNVDADVAQLLSGLRLQISMDGSTVDFGDGTSVEFSTDGDPHKPLVLDLNKILIGRERKKYMEGANTNGERSSSELRRETRKSSKRDGGDVDAAAVQQAVDDFEAANNKWLHTLQPKRMEGQPPGSTHDDGASDDAAALRALQRARNVLAAAEHSCSAAERHHQDDWQCTEDVLALTFRVKDQLVALESTGLAGELATRVDTLAAVARQRIDRVRAVSARLCSTLHRAQSLFVAGYEGKRFTAVLDTLLPLLETGVAVEQHPEAAENTATTSPSDGGDAVVRTLGGFSAFIEHGHLTACPADTAIDAAELRAELWYTAALVRLVVRGRLGSPSANEGHPSEDALGFLNVLQASHMGSTNARLALGTMQDAGYVAQQDCWAAVGALVGVARAASKHMVASLERVYLLEQNAQEDPNKASRRTRTSPLEHQQLLLQSARQFFRADHTQFTIFNQDQSTSTRRTIEEVYVALQERFTTSKSTYAAYQLLNVVRSLFWGSRKVAMKASTPTSDNEDALLLHCWTWVIAARYAPRAVVRFRGNVAAKCAVPFPDTYVLFKNELHGAMPEVEGFDAAPDSAWMAAWVRQSTMDIHLYLVTVDCLTLLSLQELLMPTEPHPEAPTPSSASPLDYRQQVGAPQYNALARSKQLLSAVVQMAERMHDDGSAVVEAMGPSPFQSMTSTDAALAEMDWHASLCLLSRIERQRAVGDEDVADTTTDDAPPEQQKLHLGPKTGAASSGFLRSELFFVRGLAEHLSGDDAVAAEWLMRGAALELEESDGPVRLLLGRLIAGPLDGTTSERRGDCLFLLAHLLSDDASLFDALRVAGARGLVMDVPGVSMFHYHSGQHYSDALIATASASPIHHRPSIVEGIFRKWAQSHRLLAQSGASGAAAVFAECPAVLADLRHAMQQVHEQRQLQVVQWLSDRTVEWHEPKRVVSRLVNAISSWVCSAIGEVVGVDCRLWFESDVRPPAASGRTANTYSRFRDTLNNWTDRFGLDAGAAVLDVTTSLEWLSFWLQQGSAEALASILELSLVAPRPDNAMQPSYLRTTALSLTHLVYPYVAQILDEESTIYQIPAHRGNDGSSKRHALSQDPLFLLAPSESRLEAAHAAAYSAGVAHFQAACDKMAGSGSETVDPFVCGLPDDGTSLLSILRLKRSAYTDRFLHWKHRQRGGESNGHHQGAAAPVLAHMHQSMAAFASCSGPVVHEWFRQEVWERGDRGNVSMLMDALRHQRSHGQGLHGLLAGSPRCMLALATMLTNFGAPIGVATAADDMQDNALGGHQLSSIVEALMDVAMASSEQLSLFHRYTLSPEEQQESAVQAIAADGDVDADATESNDDDPDDTRLQEPSLTKLHARATARHTKPQPASEWFSVKPMAYVDPSGIPDAGEGQWIVMRRMNIVASYYAAWWYKQLARWGGVLWRAPW